MWKSEKVKKHFQASMVKKSRCLKAHSFRCGKKDNADINFNENFSKAHRTQVFKVNELLPFCAHLQSVLRLHRGLRVPRLLNLGLRVFQV